MTCEHGKCNNFGLWHVQAVVPSSLSKHSCTTPSLRTPRRHLSLHATSNLCCLVPIGLTLCYWAFSYFFIHVLRDPVSEQHSWVIQRWTYSIVTVPEVLSVPIHDEFNYSHK